VLDDNKKDICEHYRLLRSCGLDLQLV
jgi:hypothetical protein